MSRAPGVFYCVMPDSLVIARRIAPKGHGSEMLLTVELDAKTEIR